MRSSAATFALLSLVALPLSGFAQEAKPAGGLELVFLREGGPVLLRVNVKIGDQLVDDRYQAYLKKWFDFLDRNDDKKLDAREIAGAPKAAGMTQLLRVGGFFNAAQSNLTMAELGKGADGLVDLAEFIAYYRRNNFQPIAVAPNFANQSSDQASDILFKALDQSKDGKLSKEELAAAATSLRKFDLDDDELVAVQELSPNPLVFNRGFAGGMQQPGTLHPSFFLLDSPATRDRLPVLLLSHYDKDKNTKLSREECGFDGKLFARLDKNQDAALDLEELASWASDASDLEFVLQLSATPGDVRINLERAAEPLKTSAKKAAPGSYVLYLGDAEINLQGRDAAQVGRFDQRQTFVQQFRFADKNQRGFLEMADVQGQQFQFLRSFFTVADRNGDGKMTLEELQAYGALQAEGQRIQVSLGVQEQGRVLFQILDGNRDGRLSARELRTAWSRLAERDLDKDGAIGSGEIPRQFQVVVALGPAQNLFIVNPAVPGFAVQPVRTLLPKEVPDWFRKMDVNGDSDVSAREFLGTRAEFERIDANRDGLIDPQEAIDYDAEIRARK